MKVFITYSRSDQEQVSSFVRDLEELNHDVWFDQDLSGGQSWWDNILSKIRDCELYIFAITQESIDSTACKREMKYAESLRRNSLPVLFSNKVSMAMAPRYISQMQFINYTNPGDKTALFALLKAINNLPPVQSLPDPLPAPPDVPISYLDTVKEKIEAPSLDKRDQTELLGDLKQRLNDPDTKREDVIHLLKKLRRHDDLLASIGAEIDVVLREVQTNAPSQPQSQQRYSDERKSTAQPQSAPPEQNFSQPNSGLAVNTVAKKDDSWKGGTMTALVIGSLIIPLLGIIFGIIGLVNGGGKKSQGVILLIVSVVGILIWSSFSSDLSSGY
ncbi:MAG: TIR domain-containing protein [Bacteroidetes bacterium]|nr:MAG: TIR domain-containing protein [Bacteroidota bacterium]